MAARPSDHRPSLARRLSRRPRRGAALMEALLALAVIAVAALGANAWFQAQGVEARQRAAARQVAVLADAARVHVQKTYAALVQAASRTWTASSFPVGVLPGNFLWKDSMKRDLKVLVLPDSASGTVRALSGQFPAAGDVRHPGAAVAAEAEPAQFMGVVEEETGCNASGAQCRCPGTAADRLCLVGPAVSADLADFDTAFPNELQPRAIMTLYEYSSEAYCGDFLHRTRTNTPFKVCSSDVNKMSQALTIVGSVTNAASIESFKIDLHGPLTVGGKLTAGALSSGTARMTAGTGMQVHTVTNITGTPTRNDACSTPSSPSASVCIDDRVIVEGNVEGGTVAVKGKTGGREADADAGDIDVFGGCLQVDGTADVTGHVRVAGDYATSKGSC